MLPFRLTAHYEQDEKDEKYPSLNNFTKRCRTKEHTEERKKKKKKKNELISKRGPF
jgi:hypothetical protein